MNLLKQVKLNKTATVKNVKSFFTNDFEHYLNLSGKHRTDLASPTFDASGVTNHSGVNHQEQNMSINIDAGNCVQAVNDAIANCTNTRDMPYATIIYYYYIKRLDDYKIYERLGYQKAQYYRLKSSALLEFAERLDYWRQQDQADLPDLRVYEKNKPVMQ